MKQKTHKISLKLTNISMTIAILFGLIISCIQLVSDYQAQQKKAKVVVEAILNATYLSASQSVFFIDAEYGEQILAGLLNYPFIHKGVIFDENGDIMSVRERSIDTNYEVGWFQYVIHEHFTEHSLNLVYPQLGEDNIGRITILVDNYIQMSPFYTRAMMLFISEMVKYLLIALVFLVVFQHFITRPLMIIVHSLEAINVKNPSTFHLDIPKGHEYDELGTLAFTGSRLLHTITTHLHELTKAENEVRALNLTLEDRIDERTKELQIAKQEAETANQSKSTFLANMSHELRSPLSAILGFAQILTRSQQLDKESQENVGIISRSGEHLLNLINQVLDLSKIEAGRTTLNENNFDLYRLLDDLEDMFHLKADDKHLLLQFERAPSVSQYIYTDELKVRQVLINLLNNALKFTLEGGITVRIKSKTIETELKQQRVIIEFAIEDTGPGIAPDELGELFTAFVQTSTGKQSQEGTGLGLPISRKFVQLMGGDMVVSSEVERGTTFQFQIQCQLSEATDIKQQFHEKRIIALAPNQPRYRILIVDDKWTNRQLLIKLLNPLGFELKEAENGQQAIDAWEEWQPHLIWMDMRMPVMDGYTATQQIKAHLKGQATAIIALTASVLEEERAVVIDAGCDDFLRKPFKEKDIFDIMHKQIGVEYIYDEPTQTSAIKSQKDELTPDNLATLPAELLARFEEATDLNDPDQIESIINEIRVQSPNLANGFLELAEMFDYDAILDLIRQTQRLQS